MHALTWNNNVGNAFFVVITRFSIDTRKTFFPFLLKLTFHCKKNQLKIIDTIPQSLKDFISVQVNIKHTEGVDFTVV